MQLQNWMFFSLTVLKKTSYDELSDDAKSFIKNIENQLNTPVTIIGTGPAINHVVDRRN